MPMLCEMHAAFQVTEHFLRSVDLKIYQSSKGEFILTNIFLYRQNGMEIHFATNTKKNRMKVLFNLFLEIRVHRRLWIWRRICESAPKAKLVHSISTGYAGSRCFHKVSQSIPYLDSEDGIYTLECLIYLFQENGKNTIRNRCRVLGSAFLKY